MTGTLHQQDSGPETPASRDVSRPGWWVLVAATIVVVALAIAAGPRPLALPDRQTGDAALAADVRTALGTRPGTHAVAVAIVEPDGVRMAGLGDSGDPAHPHVDAGSAFEIGSITKALNGMLLATLSDDGVVAEDTRVGTVLRDAAIRRSAVGDVTLQELAQHRSGLRSVPTGGPLGLLRSIAADFRGDNPYPDWSAGTLLARAARESTDGRGDYAYSNFGAAVLGHSLAEAAGTDYPDLLRTRVLAPLGMRSTTVATSQDALPRQRISGTGYTGQARAPWISAGYAPAGSGVWSTTGDMARVLHAMLDGSAPGADAAEPTTRIDDDMSIGLGWVTSRIDGRDITWHNGATGGFGSWIGFDREAGRGVVVLSASDRDVDQLGEHLLGVAPPPAARGWSAPELPGLVSLGFLVMVVLVAASTTRRVRSARVAHRLDLAGGIATVVALLAVAWRRGPWLETSWLLWSAAAAIAGAAIAAQGWYARGLPWRPRGWRPVASAVANIAIALLFVTWVL
jgi:CubicO group peptidase (beta-lactamase class C family)